ncbi:TetR/AcrR family transcriptional regulator [Nocardioides speluncae]|uniref:TetR/AcrR family transcriptional regulator n=1 Tax=Nocardioides speluncae TaxID=2670337 RepID=UPI000D690C63|nr:TetR/AcrR family transcriptional regulator [Nocardioides speluncae]
MSGVTRDARRQATRQAIVAATAECLASVGYSSVRTRQIAQAAGVAQGTVTHHFMSRDELMAEAVSYLIKREVARIRAEFAGPRTETFTIEDALDVLWAAATSPDGLAISHIWHAAWTDPRIAPVVRSLEDEVFSAVVDTLSVALGSDGSLSREDEIAIDVVLSTVRGLVQSIPARGLASVNARWAAAKPKLLTLAAAPQPRRS